MSDEDRLDRIERRLSALEAIVSKLAPAALVPPRAQPVPPPVTPEATPTKPSPAQGDPPRESFAAAPSVPRGARPGAGLQGAEQWIGQRGLLAVGVVLLILAAGYLLKLAFDRGWISPALRCAGGGVAGVAVGVLGWRLYHRGLRTYGAALMGTGAAIVYLALWAAARLYALIPSGIGIAGLAVASLALAAVGYRLQIQALGSTAALGALFAPIVVGSDQASADALLIYLGVVGVTLGWVGAVRRWRLTSGLVAFSYFGLGSAGIQTAVPWGLLAYALVGGTGGLMLGLRARWPETRFLSFGGAWGLLAVAATRMVAHWPIVAGAIVLASPIWWRALRSPTIWPDPAVTSSDRRWSPQETLYFYLTPLLVALSLRPLQPEWFARHEGAAALIVALPYLAAGFARYGVPFALAGTTALALAAHAQWAGIGAVWVLLGLTLLWATLDHVLERADGRWYALLAVAAALGRLLFANLVGRGDGPAFLDAWALSLWLALLTIVALAMGLWKLGGYEDHPTSQRHDPHRPFAHTTSSTSGRGLHEQWLELGDTLPLRIPPLLWVMAGALLLGGVTGELDRFVGQRGFAADTAQLVSGFSVSAWWAVFAGGLVVFGFYRKLMPVRVAGLIVAALAVAKVVLYDLSRLDALYRVASVFILAVVSLLVAYLYHRQGKSAEPGPGSLSE